LLTSPAWQASLSGTIGTDYRPLLDYQLPPLIPIICVERSQKEIADFAGVAGVTVRQSYKLMLP